MLETLYKEALDRKKSQRRIVYQLPFDKGLDKILKKVGEEATEVVIEQKMVIKKKLPTRQQTSHIT